MPNFNVHLFAHLKDRHGDCVRVEAEPDVEGILDALKKLGVKTDACRLSLNREFVKGNPKVAQDDEVALIPPVSGG